MASDSKWIEFDCLKVEQPIGTFYIGSIPCNDVFEVASADVHRIDERDIERYVGIQRELKQKRVTEIAEYVENIDATFPTSIILAVDKENAVYNPKKRTLRIRRDDDVAQIIDGQHRIAGLKNFGGVFELNVTIFVDMDLQDKAMTFATINLAQTKVNRSLVYNLFSFQKARSPQKTCHQIARLLHSEEGSPLRGRIKLLGRATGEDFQFITQATLVKSLVSYISLAPDKDRNAIRRKKPLPEFTDAEWEQMIFRQLWIDKQDDHIATIVWNLFDAIAKRWPEAWNESERGFVLNRTTGFTAAMRLLGPLYRERAKNNKLSVSAISSVLNSVELEYNDFTTEEFKPGSQGSTKLFRLFMDALH